jgi:hypothetical protein
MRYILNPSLHPSLRQICKASRDKTREGFMYLKKVDGPRQVTLPDGTILSRADLPPPDTRRWVASRKAIVVRAVAYGLIEMGEALDRYSLSEEEFESWRQAIEVHGEAALKVTAIQKYRQL